MASTPYIGEIRCFGFNFAPVGWQTCNGSLLPISQFDALFNLIGTTYGGDGQTTFGVPDLRGRVPIHQGNGSVIGQQTGVESVILSASQMPAHNHLVVGAIVASGGANEHLAAPTAAAYFATSAPDQLYSTAPTINTAFSASAIGSSGAGLPHENRQPLLVLNFCISLFGIFPSQN